MRKGCLTLLIAMVCALLSGCSLSQEVEHQAYALVLGVDRTSDGALEATIRIPRIGQSKSSQDRQSEEASPYMLYSARGGSFAQALERLRAVLPRDLNLSHITLLVVSEALASEEGFAELMRQIAETPHLYTSARFAVCAGSAAEFIRALKVAIGTRLSADIDAMFEHYAGLGSIPDSNLAEVYFATNTVYSDPAAIWAFLAPGEDAAEEAAAIGSAPRASAATAPVRQRFEGAAIFSGGSLALRLDARDTLLMNLILGKQSSLALEHAGKSYTLTPVARPDTRVETAGDAARIRLRVTLTSIDDIDRAASRQIEDALASEMAALIEKCQAHGVEPFGFAGRAAARFATIDAWLAWDWRARFPEARAEVRVTLRCSSGNR